MAQAIRLSAKNLFLRFSHIVIVKIKGANKYYNYKILKNSETMFTNLFSRQLAWSVISSHYNALYYMTDLIAR